jgi:hypothetical protein
MPEREVTWDYQGEAVRMGDTDTFVYEQVTIRGRGLKGAPDLFAQFKVQDGTPECVEFNLRAQELGRGIRSADLRLFDLERITIAAFTRRTLKPAAGERRYEPIIDDREFWSAVGAVTTATQRRQSANQAELSEVARLYDEHVDPKVADDEFAGKPTKAVQVAMGYSARTAARRVQQARDAGLLPGTTPGKKKGRTAS